ncbi:aminotransferase class I/II-fold pyridoxal phosphate-dependent enzyme [Adlercreutzia sp. R21]|uniref:threonine aldolase family protein n=1 Tax=Adlercreutzia wanghongyangiae TaxID=3111451 RepID=UPI002DC00CC0|nr:aminotransferase class I/II-fold pyridoxal phosphate-dependent enzyme [Adlercreutzia sp. R21]MEC4184434.1 aminotransferase class I/II-fold pyridoxal phosphate-dependent enzyme [Adlercreutzia sp. R21]
MISFENDYSTGAHPRVLEALAATNLEPAPGYGSDRFCESATARIRAACDDETADVFFLTGGTQTNAVVISALLAGHEGVIAADTGHIAVHEAGAVEATGHKVITLPEHDGKLRAADAEAYLDAFYADASFTHMVFPGMVFIAHPSELGTLYSLAELEALAAVCRRYEIPLYLDGARLAYGLAAPETDVTLPDIARLVDAFYIGGTKCGALCGEAVVFPRGGMPRHFLTHVKQHGALLAKGRLLGVQFDALFTDGLYAEVGRTAMNAAAKLRRVLRDAGCEFFRESPTNQQFIVLENAQAEALAERIRFSTWEKLGDGRTVIRLVTSWSTTPDDLAALEEALRAAMR